MPLWQRLLQWDHWPRWEKYWFCRTDSWKLRAKNYKHILGRCGQPGRERSRSWFSGEDVPLQMPGGWSSFILTDPCWSSLILIDHHWSSLIFIDLHWTLLILINLHPSLWSFWQSTGRWKAVRRRLSARINADLPGGILYFYTINVFFGDGGIAYSLTFIEIFKCLNKMFQVPSWLQEQHGIQGACHPCWLPSPHDRDGLEEGD